MTEMFCEKFLPRLYTHRILVRRRSIELDLSNCKFLYHKDNHPGKIQYKTIFVCCCLGLLKQL